MADETRATELAAEQHYVDRVYARVEVLRGEAEKLQREGHRLASGRTPGSLVERDAMVYHAAQRLRVLDSEYEGLVFGRLDLAGGEVRHIGRLGLLDTNADPLVVDWRAPNAAPFYQATTEEPLGVVRRRVITCRGPRVVEIEDDLLDDSAAEAVAVVGDGALLATLARAKTDRMRDIVSTIQREQDEAIRAPAGGVTLIEGGPGTGKTAVALHRAAHLLYRDRRRFEGGGVLLVGPSSTFMSYVDRVLPSLGEETAELRSLGEVMDGYASDRLDPPHLHALKGSSRMRRFLLRAARLAPPTAPTELRLIYSGQLLRVTPERLAQARREVDNRVAQHNAAGPEARRQLVTALWADRPAGVTWATRDFSTELYGRDDFEAFARAWWPIVTPAQVLAWLADPSRAREAGRDWLGAADCAALARSFGQDHTVADIALLDELRAILGEPPKPPRRRNPGRVGVDQAGDDIHELSTVAEREFAPRERPARPANYDGYAHILVDEAQDLSPMQWRMLGRRGGQASWTIVGDLAQSAWPDLDDARRARDEALRGKPLRRFHLSTNYRNSAEIYSFAASVVRRAVPDADLPRAVRETGAHPTHLLVPVVAEAVAPTVEDLLTQVEGTVGVIAPADQVAEISSAIEPLVKGGRVAVVDGMRAKGLEYDGVVVVAPDQIQAESPAGVRVLYVALTRATHRLVTIATTSDWRPTTA